MRALSHQEEFKVSAGEAKLDTYKEDELDAYAIDSYVMAGVLITAFSVGTSTAYGGYCLTLHNPSWSWRMGALLTSFYGGFAIGSLAGAGTLLGLCD